MRGYFEGWYLKQQAETGTVALIPAVHRRAGGETAASLQVITEEGSWNLPVDRFAYDRSGRRFQLEDSVVTPRGCQLHLTGKGVSVEGQLWFSGLTPPRYDIMGPFCLTPFMQCRHSVFSMAHRVNGRLRVNDTTYRFRQAPGYMEGDRGSSFPSRYLWTQCSWKGGCVMLSAADIPFLGGHFTGCIGVVYAGGTEKRFATYLGAKVEAADAVSVRVRQGDAVLTVRLLKEHPHPLFAPVEGGMGRTIHESVSCRTLYDLQEGGRRLLHFVSDRASFESAWTNSR
ncbi:MAG: hypothetical protein HFE86_07065 [Clostridiales bacterium]|nr:hypothetical protein [Clostridiales bacterium]